MDLDINWTVPVNIYEENNTGIVVNENVKERELINLRSVHVQTMDGNDFDRLSRNRYVN